MRTTAACLLAPIFVGHFLGHQEQSQCDREDQHHHQEWTRFKTLSLKWHCLRETQVSLWKTDTKTFPCLQEKTLKTKPQSLEKVSIKSRIDINAVSLSKNHFFIIGCVQIWAEITASRRDSDPTRGQGGTVQRSSTIRVRHALFCLSLTRTKTWKWAVGKEYGLGYYSHLWDLLLTVNYHLGL